MKIINLVEVNCCNSKRN